MQLVSFFEGRVSGTDATDTCYLYNPFPHKVLVTGFTIVPKTAVSVHANNYITTTITNPDAATLATHTTNSSGGSAMVAGTPIDLAFGAAGVGTALELAAGAKLTVAITKAGTGPAYDFQVYGKVSPLART